MGLPIPGDLGESKQHLHAIHSLAFETGTSEDELAEIYSFVLTGLYEEAKVKTYLPILVSRKVKSILTRGGGAVSPLPSRRPR
jgi:hypothetical protein